MVCSLPAFYLRDELKALIYLAAGQIPMVVGTNVETDMCLVAVSTVHAHRKIP